MLIFISTFFNFLHLIIYFFINYSVAYSIYFIHNSNYTHNIILSKNIFIEISVIFYYVVNTCVNSYLLFLINFLFYETLVLFIMLVLFY